MREAYRSDLQARKFYSQRNMYLSGFTLFLSLVLHRAYTMVNTILAYEDTISELKEHSNESTKSGQLIKENKDLRDKIDAKDRDLAALKKQAEGLSKEYHSLGDSVNQKAGTAAPSESRKDI